MKQKIIIIFKFKNFNFLEIGGNPVLQLFMKYLLFNKHMASFDGKEI